MSGRNVGVSQRNTVLNCNRRLLLWWSQQKKDVNDVNIQFDNGQSGHGPPRGEGGMAGLPPPLDPPLPIRHTHPSICVSAPFTYSSTLSCGCYDMTVTNYITELFGQYNFHFVGLYLLCVNGLIYYRHFFKFRRQLPSDGIITEIDGLIEKELFIDFDILETEDVVLRQILKFCERFDLFV